MLNKRSYRSGLRIALLSGCVALAACSNEIRVHGNLPDTEVLAEVHPGVDTRNDVLAKLGTPSTLSTFRDNIWYYIGYRMEQGPSIMAAEEIERSVFVVSFSPAGVVQETKLYTMEDGQEIEPVDRETPTEGQELTIIEQLLGNFGKRPLSDPTKKTN